MSEPTIPPPSSEDMLVSLDEQFDYFAEVSQIFGPVMAIIRRCHAAETELAALRSQLAEDPHAILARATETYTTATEGLKQKLREAESQRDELQKKLDDAMRVLSEWGNIDKAQAVAQRDELLKMVKVLRKSVPHPQEIDKLIASVEREKGGQP